MIVPAQRDTLITTPRLVIAPPERRDFKDWSDLRSLSRQHLEQWEPRWPSDAHTRSDWTRRMRTWREGWRTQRSFVFLMRRLDDDALVGGLSLTHVRRWPALSASLGYWLGVTHGGNGFMREAVTAICDWGFYELGLCRVEAGTLAENARSRSVLEAAGFIEEGYAKGYLEIAGERRDHVLYGLVRPDLRG